MKSKMRDHLKKKNEALRGDITAIVRLSADAKIVPELEPYRSALLKHCADLLSKIEKNLLDLSVNQNDLLPDILSETSTLIQWARFFKYRFVRPLNRASDWDRVCLRTISWLHGQHSDTKRFPAVFADDDISISPSTALTPFYFFPCIEQRTLLFQPLLFHEFGHLLYLCHKRELDELVGEFQQVVEGELLPASQRNDQHSLLQMKTRQSVVEVWYSWIQEFFCDAVGLVIGGPCFLNAFADYMAKYQVGDYYRQPANLHGSSHPLSWLRIQRLAERAIQRGFPSTATKVVEEWRGTARLLGVVEDYHGFYTESLGSSLTKTLDDMLTEVAPRECTVNEAQPDVVSGDDPGNLVSLLNRVWQEYHRSPDDFLTWEKDVLRKQYNLTVM